MNCRKRAGIGTAACWIVFAFASLSGLAPAPIVAQNSDTTDAKPNEVTPPISGITLLDAAINRNEYRLGPGDLLSIALFGEVNRSHTVSVTPEGTIVMPGLGFTRVLGLNLDQAEARVRDLVRKYYRRMEVTLTLSQVRTFKVFVLGNTTEPGMRVATAATRASELLPRTIDMKMVPRNVQLHRINGDTIRVDLLRFQQTGDFSANPTLREGDRLVLPPIAGKIEVVGSVAYPGAYEFLPGETLAELLSLANGGASFPPNAADTVRVARFDDRGNRTVHLLSTTDAVGARGRAFTMRPFDGIYVPEVVNYRRQYAAVVTGQVQRPGTYPISPDTTTVRELVAMAGGFTDRASLVDATLRRPPRERPVGDSIPIEFLSSLEQRIVAIQARGDQTNVVVDFARLFAEGKDLYNHRLRDGDQLNIPMARAEVVVLGAVPSPGILPHVPGRSARYYIELAGGFSRRADRNAMVLRSRLGTPIEARDVKTVDPGDQIVVAYKEPRSVLDLLLQANTVVTTVSGLLAAIALLRVL